jgi:hypothetical protein
MMVRLHRFPSNHCTPSSLHLISAYERPERPGADVVFLYLMARSHCSLVCGFMTFAYGWMPHNASFGFLDLAPSILHSNWFWDYIS